MTVQHCSERPAGRLGAQRTRQLRARAARHVRESGEIGRRAVPLVAAGALNMAISLTDTAMMAWLDPRALAGGAVVSDVYSIVFYFATGVLAAVTPMAAAAIGGGAPERVGAITGHALILLVGLAAGGFWIVSTATGLLARIGVDLPDAGAAAEYGRYMAWAFVFMLAFALGRSTLAALGRGRPPMIILMLAVPLNALFNYVLMFGACGAPEMGLAGAGAASVIVAASCAVGVAGYLLLVPSMARYGFRRGLARFQPTLVLQLARTGVMIALATVAETGIFLISTIAVGMVAAEAVPAHAMVFRLLGLGYCLIVGFGQAVTVRIAVAHGGGDRRRERLTERTADMVALALAAGFVATTMLLAGTIGLTPVETSARGMIDTASALLPLTGLALAALTLGSTSCAILRGRSDVSTPAAITVAGYWLVGFTTMVVLTQTAAAGSEGVWLGLCAGSTAAAAATGIYRAARQRRLPDVLDGLGKQPHPG